MGNRKGIEALLRSQPFSESVTGEDSVYHYAESMARVENPLVVVSDIKANTSRIFYGRFADVLSIRSLPHENSIWEKEILAQMDESEQEGKYLSELRFFNFLRRIPHSFRPYYYLAAHLRIKNKRGIAVDVLHRMYYWYEGGSEVVRYGICVYGPLLQPLPAKYMAVNSVTGEVQELSGSNDQDILSKREKQILSLIVKGLTSQEIADMLCISKHTVSRHRQEILAKLQARNSAGAILRARQLQLI